LTIRNAAISDHLSYVGPVHGDWTNVLTRWYTVDGLPLRASMKNLFLLKKVGGGRGPVGREVVTQFDAGD
jgi:hypothetical protein